MAEIERIAPDTLRLECLLDAPVDTVWRWLVDPDLRAQWFAGGSEAKADSEITLVFDHDNLSADDVPCPPAYAEHRGATAREQVVAFDPPRRLAFSWGGGKEDVVAFDLTPLAARTRLVLTHSGISSAPAMADFGGGWLSHLAVLEARVAGRTIPDFWALHAACAERVAEALG